MRRGGHEEELLFALSARGVYGLTAMVELATRHESGPTQIREIAEGHEIPQHYLEQILVALKKSGLVDSHRGAQGGYILARQPGHIDVLEILTVLEGPLEIAPTPRKDDTLDFYWNDLDRRLREILSLSLEELASRASSSKGRLTYVI